MRSYQFDCGLGAGELAEDLSTAAIGDQMDAMARGDAVLVRADHLQHRFDEIRRRSSELEYTFCLDQLSFERYQQASVGILAGMQYGLSSDPPECGTRVGLTGSAADRHSHIIPRCRRVDRRELRRRALRARARPKRCHGLILGHCALVVRSPVMLSPE
jgi:hypothetical protein